MRDNRHVEPERNNHVRCGGPNGTATFISTISTHARRAIGRRRRRTPIAAGQLRLIGDRAMFGAIRETGIGGLAAEMEIGLARMTDRPFAALVAPVEQRRLALDVLAWLGRKIGRAHG